LAGRSAAIISFAFWKQKEELKLFCFAEKPKIIVDRKKKTK